MLRLSQVAERLNCSMIWCTRQQQPENSQLLRPGQGEGLSSFGEDLAAFIEESRRATDRPLAGENEAGETEAPERFGLLQHELMIGCNLRIELVDHGGVRMAGERRNDVRIDAGDEFSSHPCVPEQILAVSDAELFLQPSKTAFHR